MAAVSNHKYLMRTVLNAWMLFRYPKPIAKPIHTSDTYLVCIRVFYRLLSMFLIVSLAVRVKKRGATL